MLTYLREAKLFKKLDIRAVMHAMSVKLVDIDFDFAGSKSINEEVVPWESILQVVTQS